MIVENISRPMPQRYMAGPGIEPGTSDALPTALRGPGYKSRRFMVIIQVVPIFFIFYLLQCRVRRN